MCLGARNGSHRLLVDGEQLEDSVLGGGLGVPLVGPPRTTVVAKECRRTWVIPWLTLRRPPRWSQTPPGSPWRQPSSPTEGSQSTLLWTGSGRLLRVSGLSGYTPSGLCPYAHSSGWVSVPLASPARSRRRACLVAYIA